MAVSRLTEDAWQKWLDLLPAYSFFQTPCWARILTDSGLEKESGAWLFQYGQREALLPFTGSQNLFGWKGYKSMPFGTYGGILVNKESAVGRGEDFAGALIQDLRRVSRFVHWVITPGYFSHLELPGIEISNTTHCIDLHGGAQTVWKGFPCSTRNFVRQAERAHVEVQFDNSVNAFYDYYEMLENSAKRWGKTTPGKPWKLFQAISERATPDMVRLWLARVDKNLVAGALCVYGRGEVFYWSGAMYKELARTRANNLLHWWIIRDAIERGYTWYNMGASDGLPGVRRFKEGFGAVPVRYPTYILTARGLRPAYQLLLSVRDYHTPTLHKIKEKNTFGTASME